MSPFTPVPIAISVEQDIAARRRGESPEAAAFLDFGIAPNQQADWAKRGKLYANDVYQVAVQPFIRAGMHLAVRRLDRQPVVSWGDLQAIKDALVGPEYEGLELFPAASRRIAGTVHRHLWCQREDGFRFPFGFQTKHTKDGNTPAGSMEFTG